MGPPTTLFPNFMLLCKRFHSISALTANFQAASHTFPHPLNHLTAIFFKTSTFCLLPICHPPFLHPSFFTHFHLPLCLQAAMEMMAPSAASPHISSVRLLPSLMAWQTAAERELNPATTTSYLSGSLQEPAFYPAPLFIELIQCHWGKTQLLRNPRSLGSLQSCLVQKSTAK